MNVRWIAAFVLVESLAGLARAAVDSSITVNATGAVSQSAGGFNFTAKGTAMLTGFGVATFTVGGQITGVQSGSFTGPVSGAFTLDYSGGQTLTGTFSIPGGILVPTLSQTTAGSGSLTVTGGTGALDGTTGSFPTVTGSGMATGTFTSTFQFSGAGSLNLGPLAAPAPAITAVLNSASGDTRLSPGCLATVSGTNLKGQSMSVQVSGKPVGLINAAAASLSIQIPVDASTGPAILTEQRDALTSGSFNLTLDAVAPAIMPGKGGIGSFFHANGGAVTTDNPAAPQETIRLAAACLGPTNPPIPTGGTAPVGSSVVTVSTPNVKVANKAATVTASVAEPNLVGTYSVYFTVPAGTTSGNQPVVLSIGNSNSNVAQLPVGPAVPVVSAIVNGASFGSSGTLAPGEFAAVFGFNFGDQDKLDAFPGTNFNAVSVTFNGTAAPLFSLIASAGQINLVTPSELPETGAVTVVVKNQLGSSQTFSGRMTSTSPGIFLIPDPSNAARRNAAALFANTAWRVVPESMATALGWPAGCRGTGISAATVCGESATAGDNIEIFTTGLGKATPGGDPKGTPLATGAVAPADGSTLYLTVQKPVVTVGSVPVDVQFSGIAPGSAGLYQVNIQIPAGAPKGDAVPVVISMPNGASDTATIPIR
ncbi:MAG: hypothetical protein LAP38_19485 [Acidobacteriia bacterium]|nr:hypothetical protein [Terriglobia bacterium]